MSDCSGDPRRGGPVPEGWRLEPLMPRDPATEPAQPPRWGVENKELQKESEGGSRGWRSDSEHRGGSRVRVGAGRGTETPRRGHHTGRSSSEELWTELGRKCRWPEGRLLEGFSGQGGAWDATLPPLPGPAPSPGTPSGWLGLGTARQPSCSLLGPAVLLSAHHTLCSPENEPLPLQGARGPGPHAPGLFGHLHTPEAARALP